MHLIFDYFDQEFKNPKTFEFEKELKAGTTFTQNGVTYEVVKEIKSAVIRMVKYQIPNTATQFIHKCPAKKRISQTIEKCDVMNLKDIERVKLQGQMQSRCPYCKVIFWKESMELPEQIQIPKVLNKVKLIRRHQP